MRNLSRWHMGLLVIVGIGLFFLATGYDAGLPLYESVDERHNLDEIYILRGIKDDPLWKPGYPPGILYLNYGAQLVTEAITGQSAWDQACMVIQNVRVTGIVANLITAVLIALTARKLGGDLAGWLAPLAWLVAPRVLAQAQFGFPQVYEALFYVLALYLALLALEHRRTRHALLSVAAGLGGVIFKYVTFPALGLGVGAALWNLLRADRQNRKRWWGVLALQIIGIALAAIALLTLGGVGSLAGSGHVETNAFLSDGFAKLLDTELVGYIFTNVAGQIGLSLLVLSALIVVGSVLYWRQAALWQRLGWIGTVGLGLLHALLLAMYIFHLDGIDRNILSSSGVFAIIIAVAAVSIARWLADRLNRPTLQYVAVSVFAAVWLVPQVIGAWDWVQYRSLPVTYAALVEWTETTLPQETLLVNDNRPFIRDWNCVNYLPREIIWDADLMDQPLESWLDQGVYYTVLAQSRVEEMRATPAGQAYLNQMTLLEQFPPPGQEDQWRSWRRGEEAAVMVYQLWPSEPEIETDIVFLDGIELIGGNIEGNGLEPGSSVSVQFYWEAAATPHADYNVFMHLTPLRDPSNILAQDDGPLSRIDLRTTSTWDEPGEIFISDTFELVMPHDLQPGQYQLSLGLYNWRTGERLLTNYGTDSIILPVTIPTE